MDAEQFAKEVWNNAGKDYGLCPPPTEAQAGLSILIKHFLGENWYVMMPLSPEQVNTEAIYDILRMFPPRRLWWEEVKSYFRRSS